MGSMGKRQGDTKVIIPSKNEIKYCIIFLPPGAAVPAVFLEFAAASSIFLLAARQGKSGPVHGQGIPLRFLPPSIPGAGRDYRDSVTKGRPAVIALPGGPCYNIPREQKRRIVSPCA